MSWHAVVPFKAAGARKSRLGEVLSPEARAGLTEAMLAHVAAELGVCARIAKLSLLAPARPEGWRGEWIDDHGLPLNEALDRFTERPLLVIHADLPHLACADVDALLDAAEAGGAAIAADRHGTGTNALALFGASELAFAFGPGSLALHHAQLPGGTIVIRDGLAFDIDTPDDLAASGLRP